MKTYRQFIEESKSLSRVVSTMKKKGTGIVSAARGDNTKKQNQAASDKLVKRIKGAGLPGPKKVSGVYHEKDHGEQKEKSFIVSSGKQGKKRFKKTMQKLGQAGGLKQKRNQPADSKKKDQDSILIKQKKGTSGKASWLGTSRRKDADPKLGKKYDQGKMNTKDAGSKVKPGEGATRVGKKNLQFK